MSSVLDTNIISAMMHLEVEIVERVRELDPSTLILCSPVAAEVHFGLANMVEPSKRRSVLEQQFHMIRSVMRWADWGEEAARIFGSIKADLRRRGLPIQDLDIAIASIAISLNAKVATRNTAHFAPIEGLSVDDWSS